MEKDGVNLLGFTMWAPIDIVPPPPARWTSVRFIFVVKNNAGEGSLLAAAKKRFYWYKKVIESNGC